MLPFRDGGEKPDSKMVQDLEDFDGSQILTSMIHYATSLTAGRAQTLVSSLSAKSSISRDIYWIWDLNEDSTVAISVTVEIICHPQINTSLEIQRPNASRSRYQWDLLISV